MAEILFKNCTECHRPARRHHSPSNKRRSARRNMRWPQTDWYAMVMKLGHDDDGTLVFEEVPSIYRDRLKPIACNDDGILDADEPTRLKSRSGGQRRRRGRD